MRIDPKGTICGYPAPLVPQVLRSLRESFEWEVPDLEAAARPPPGAGHAVRSALQDEELIEAAGRGSWRLTQAGRTMSSATPIPRATAERALAQFMERVAQV